MPDLVYILFIFAFGACVGSFLNVVVWRMPRNQSLISPPSRCPSCGTHLAWYDNIPVFGWLMLRGRCRYCAQPISFRYPSVEFITGAIFVFYYWIFFIVHTGPCIPHLVPGIAGLPPHLEHRHLETIQQQWPVFGLYMFLVASLLAASLIDAELFIIPVQIPWLCAVVGLFVHALIDLPNLPGNVMIAPRSLWGPLAAGSGLGLLVSMTLFLLGKFPPSFPDGEPELEVDKEIRAEAEADAPPAPRLLGRLVNVYRGQPTPAQLKLMQACAARRDRADGDGADGDISPSRPSSHADQPPSPPIATPQQIRAEIRKEINFLLPPLAGGLLLTLLVRFVPQARAMFDGLLEYHWLSGLLGSLLGAMIGAFLIWFARILGTLLLGRVAMGLGDVHLMFGIGAIIGAGPSAVAFFLAPFAGLAVGLYSLITRNRREMPYGPYLSLATAAVLVVYCPIANYLRPGLEGLSIFLRQATGF